MECISCKKESIKGIKFNCPECKKETYRCEKCRALSIDYKCKCSYSGP
ncbi:MAG: RNA-binding protein [Nanoarchaeota archaeon]|nr:RNA-binding protein [Nanoarchaeota archaeon]